MTIPISYTAPDVQAYSIPIDKLDVHHPLLSLSLFLHWLVHLFNLFLILHNALLIINSATIITYHILHILDS
jgi:hypothetical protein